MEHCTVLNILTPKKVLLNGLWFGPNNAKRVFIFIHGLTSNAFAGHKMVLPLVDDFTAVLTFNNRGHEKIARMKKIDNRKKKGYSSLLIGEAHEVFCECIDDIQGVVNHVDNLGIHDIFLVGHSTGSQKAAYYVSRKGMQKKIRGVILLSPLSDYAGALHQDKNGNLPKITQLAKDYCQHGKSHELLPLEMWPQMHDAQRFLSLFTSDSEEEIFSYCQKDKVPKTYRSISIPQLVILGEKDESRDRDIHEIADWFEKNCQSKVRNIEVIEDGTHGFFQREHEVVNKIKNFILINSL